ncbi:M48 family metallopeptidase [Bryobacter aggregatus]|uniref:M48 family metallopeptidase n=1 Tax=Bryobacter aggregatus TaxID=360054 RepID=UPI000560BC8D|nr:M48 family metallopeptidase [Bryobacter aggregatus]
MRWKIGALIVGTLLLVGLVLSTAYAALPYALGGVARLVPISLEDKLGSMVLAGLVREHRPCENPELTAMMQAIATRLSAAMDASPYRFDIQVLRSPQVNAMAAPGGHIAVFSGLVDRMDNPEQVAAVLAHEMQHVVQRHSVKGILRALGIQTFLTIVVGDPGVLGDLAGNLGVLHFMRSDEESADDAAIQVLMRAGIAPVEMQKAFENLAKSGGGESGSALSYLSTHPPLADRIERVRQASMEWQGQARPIGVSMPRTCLP